MEDATPLRIYISIFKQLKLVHFKRGLEYASHVPLCCPKRFGWQIRLRAKQEGKGGTVGGCSFQDSSLKANRLCEAAAHTRARFRAPNACVHLTSPPHFPHFNIIEN
jgi:hypothetical protein